MMRNAYLAICYYCNENCCFCPCSKVEKSEKMITNIEEIIHTVNSLKDDGVTDITISGGEPTLHPNFIEIIRYIYEIGLQITVLTNSERFSDDSFLTAFINEINTKKIKIITTLHSEIAEEHEKANQTKGSFERSVKGLLNLSEHGIRIIVKHCITKSNYKALKTFYSFCDELFLEDVDIQLCSIDYCGIPENKLEKEMLSFNVLRPYLDELFEYHILLKNKGSVRNLYCINMPLCSSDVIYWDYFSKSRKKMYDLYKDPHSKEVLNISDNVGVSKIFCKECKAIKICSGTYYTAFEAFGNRVIKPYV